MAFNGYKLENAYKAMKNENIDMWIIAGQETSTKTEPALNVLCDAEFIGLTAMIFNQDKTSCAICTPIDKNGYVHQGVFDEVIDFPISFVDTLSEYIARKKPKKIALNYSLNNPASDGLSYGMYTIIKDALDKISFNGEIVSAENIMNDVIEIKTDEELIGIKKAAEIALEIFDLAKSVIKDGIDCQEVFKFFQDEVEKRGLTYSWPKSCNPAIFAGYGCPTGHKGAPNFIIKKGDLINIDFGIIVDGYSCGLQRMYYLLNEEEDVPSDLKKDFDVVVEAIDLASKALVPNVTGYQVDKLVIDFILSKGYQNFTSALGHQVGQIIHDDGQLLATSSEYNKRPELLDVPLKEGYVFRLEPSIISRAGKISIKENVCVRKPEAEFIVPPQKELILIKEG